MSCGSREPAAFHYTVVYLAVVNNEILRTEEGGDSGDVGGMTTHKNYAVLCTVNLSQGLFEFALYGALASHKSACARGCSVALHGLYSRSVDPWISVEA